ncbi:MAG: hypothetical protein G01um101472_479 [Parcubacteria group bacterium Gr01-1014_72]|nr:MAG: hypothetical protein G01um101472_479 [Parcubacteria group bacterium Gr01-1014_72]
MKMEQPEIKEASRSEGGHEAYALVQIGDFFEIRSEGGKGKEIFEKYKAVFASGLVHNEDTYRWTERERSKAEKFLDFLNGQDVQRNIARAYELHEELTLLKRELNQSV